MIHSKTKVEAITHLESSFRRGADKALLVLATGAGKTYTACMAAYRLLSYTPAKRILFLVDRNNLGEQAINEFSTFRLTQDGSPFTDIFITERIKGNKANPKASLTVSTIQRLYATLTGTAAKSDAEEDDEDREAEAEAAQLGTGKLKLPHDYFDATQLRKSDAGKIANSVYEIGQLANLAISDCHIGAVRKSCRAVKLLIGVSNEYFVW